MFQVRSSDACGEVVCLGCWRSIVSDLLPADRQIEMGQPIARRYRSLYVRSDFKFLIFQAPLSVLARSPGKPCQLTGVSALRNYVAHRAHT
ncbi:hypothetical protein BMJ34_06455 [Sinorhizobium medicae]|uniref:Uncharacterized protein n=1 Tax=Sinorhizobium medicae TaxID=110321 RepID=A0ABX4TS32_9HYPH|nr:hypothetical protein BMJ34_06455 [Sinorhizobium medicae]PLU08850.1 hypothetical protein BMJ33_02590 [Sinorhizobium medicae]PLU11711.1 hypothetical protein BMJ29_34025 [Sinorhizobium medicae]PLU21428.1 hypothetical protein BMJ30_06140 [Sinorhizobium medicae]PLU31227.1 hypothetical protein BMJ27_22205 [Sinorhizobium medicae]